MFSYIHIPFCESKCKYCRFASIGNINQKLIEKYLNYLVNDIKNFKKNINDRDLLESIYFGGGTPSILNEEQIGFILKTLKDKFGYKKNIEITLETIPKNINSKNINSWERLGINRLSIGIQTLNELALQTIKRDNKNTIIEGLNSLKNSKIQNISIDFIIGLPFVKSGEILENIKYILYNYDFIKHISIYMLEDYYEKNNSLEFENNSKFENIYYPSNWQNLGIKEEEYLQEYTEIKNYLEFVGYKRYEISNFSKKYYECKHNKSYWNHSPVIGFGLGSHSFIDGIRYAYKDDFLNYYDGIIDYKEVLIDKEIFLEKIIFGLRTFGIEKKLYKKLNKEKIEEFIKHGFLEIKDNNLTITDKSITLIDKIILEII